MMERTALRQLLVEMLEEFGGDNYAEFDEGLVLRQDLGLDSVGLISLTLEIQERCQVHFTIADLDLVVTIKDLLDLLQQRMAHRERPAA